MDLFTHVLIAYLVSFGVTGGTAPIYIAAGALAGGLPDSDALFFPLAKRFPLLRHHGITHSITGVTIIATGGALLSIRLVPGSSPVLIFAFMELGGLTHIALDGFTHFAVPPFAPFSDVQLHVDADRAINLFTLGLSIVSFYVLLSERGTVPLATWLFTGWFLLAVYGAYLASRGLGRWAAEGARKSGGFTAVIPTGNPLRWFLVEEREGSDRFAMRFVEYRVGKGITLSERHMAIEHFHEGNGPVASPLDAIRRSYLPAMARSRFLSQSYRYARVLAEPGHYLILWFSLEFHMFGRAPAVAARVDAASGSVSFEPKRRWFDMRTLADLPAHYL